jgi:hypothetical protein
MLLKKWRLDPIMCKDLNVCGRVVFQDTIPLLDGETEESLIRTACVPEPVRRSFRLKLYQYKKHYIEHLFRYRRM